MLYFSLGGLIMEKLIESIFLNFDGTTPSERRKNSRKKSCVAKVIDYEINKIFAAQAKNKMEVQNGKAA